MESEIEQIITFINRNIVSLEERETEALTGYLEENFIISEKVKE